MSTPSMRAIEDHALQPNTTPTTHEGEMVPRTSQYNTSLKWDQNEHTIAALALDAQRLPLVPTILRKPWKKHGEPATGFRLCIYIYKWGILIPGRMHRLDIWNKYSKPLSSIHRPHGSKLIFLGVPFPSDGWSSPISIWNYHLDVEISIISIHFSINPGHPNLAQQAVSLKITLQETDKPTISRSCAGNPIFSLYILYHIYIYIIYIYTYIYVHIHVLVCWRVHPTA